MIALTPYNGLVVTAVEESPNADRMGFIDQFGGMILSFIMHVSVKFNIKLVFCKKSRFIKCVFLCRKKEK